MTAFWDFPYTARRLPVLADNVIATSQPLAAAAGMRMLARGGNAVDAALATAIALTVVEPCMNGIGGDAFALIWDGETLHGLNASGRAPRAWTPESFARHSTMPFTGWDSVTVPGAVSGWRTTWERFGSLPFEDLFEPAIEYATNGYMVSHTVHRQWQAQVPVLRNEPGFAESFAPRGRAPLPGERFICPGQAETLTRIARSGGEDFYHGELARKIADHARATGGRIDEADLAAHRADWVEPIRMAYRDLELYEIGPNGQGIGALMALGMLEHWDIAESGLDSARTMHLQIEAMKLAFADLQAHVGDIDAMRRPGAVSPEALLDPAYLAERARAIRPAQASYPGPGKPHTGGTVYLTAADRNGMMVSYIQSNFKGFGSGVVVPGTGIALHNRGWGFSLEAGHPNQVAPGKRPFHTIIPGFLMRDGAPLASFGVMGGSMQAQGHVQMTSRLADFGQNPQAASDAPRWRVMDDNVGVAVEAHCPPATVEGLRAMGHKVEQAPADSLDFGGAQMAMKMPHGYAAASDSRKDGYPVGF
ncbi:gamma-glutamyltranspeptidase / glutathione hydrolase [Cupriavidus sp. OV038]|jgi:gamma-glutamyltranspeptidase/glutathione hydrolase|uniref:gamma-glutamyltransferase family protein n=1 Tax=unclassified Cupriavidus TaxID=2640874 RepID=UPI0008E9615E|nr:MULTISPECIES: gamma-glutamyltransferase family protein [unclassified Cupriavidus]SFD31036.1 gamma-glutamyltranspeptidase / glutathione hydrolase [Cupriavidus sp. OV038]SFQ01997.1 gamma-glutamyltranspeptidase / glutathione hydrolase [Cupriavidus sp. OV096]